MNAGCKTADCTGAVTLAQRAAALLICALGFPLHLFICLAIRLNDGGPALHRTPRLGKSGVVFELLKYRSMRVNAAHHLSLGMKMVIQENDPRVTAIGSFLRCGLDELPQLWNIAKGDMAWIGPRPDPDWMLPHYGPTCRERLAILPGITGFAQLLNSRYLTTSEGFALDIWYSDHHSWWLNLWIILATPLFVAGWHSVGKPRLLRLRLDPEFQDLSRRCEKEFTESQEFLLASANFKTYLPPNTLLVDPSRP
ncbi:MAG TPA: sugar transferase [Terracidiphilus sp.]